MSIVYVVSEKNYVYHTQRSCAAMNGGETTPRDRDDLDDHWRVCLRCEYADLPALEDAPLRPDGGVAAHGDPFMPDRPQEATEQAHESEKQPEDAGGTSASGNRPQDNATFTSRSLNSSDSDRRTGLRARDRHASWREVARSCHVEPGR